MRKITSVKQFVAIKPIPGGDKVETKVQGGLAMVAQKRNVAMAELVMGYQDEKVYYPAGSTKVLVPGDSGFRAWNKQVLSVGMEDFVLCPFAEVIGFVHEV